ncbi:DeHydrogenases, Short chain [Caenorhabditis elegans]|uniref:DeHydrogenases, Short chain n=1 Tax=Caenorhabditis elegans TaxID=6239 RepID=Q9N5G3_CAEEL|nr:DeHydrogenases, Short chain [Caenorhabditis elegans]CCD65483.1 DeHydrogenases, Short chain [Caenorhabditis elegans]|eukprot:NP_503752.1 DeHydrogenases, Short chain [Caenorhabditis elegans]
MTRFSGKVALVTGSSNGIGRATAVLLAQEGAKVTITGRNADRLEETRQEILKSGVPEDHVLSIATDLATEKGQDELVNSTIQKFGRLDILVNNAGAAFNDDQGRVGVDQDVSVYDRIMQINMRSVVTLTQKAKEHLVKAKGEVVNVSSIGAGPQAQPTFMYYAMSKAALDQYTRSAAIDLIQYGVRVNSVSPGAVVTGFGEAMGMPADMHEKYGHFMESRKECIPCGKMGQPIDIANIIAFLADRKLSSYIIGQSIVADGGSTLVMGMQAHNFMDLLKQ